MMTTIVWCFTLLCDSALCFGKRSNCQKYKQRMLRYCDEGVREAIVTDVCWSCLISYMLYEIEHTTRKIFRFCFSRPIQWIVRVFRHFCLTVFYFILLCDAFKYYQLVKMFYINVAEFDKINHCNLLCLVLKRSLWKILLFFMIWNILNAITVLLFSINIHEASSLYCDLSYNSQDV